MESKNKTARILIVDDDPSLLKLTRAVLEAHGYEVISSLEAAIGLEIAMTQSPDLIILDVMMPIINGFNICRLLKSDDGHKEIPIILLTSRFSQEDRRIGKEVGADGYITKPFNTEELIGKIEELLNKK